MVRAAIGIAVTVWLLARCASNMPAPMTTNPMISEAQQCNARRGLVAAEPRNLRHAGNGSRGAREIART
jgi:hypothetical protein